MARFDPQRPYNELPSLPPKEAVETRAVLKACIEARAELARLSQAGALIPNQSVLINTIPLLEAQASSEIENIVTTSDELFKYAQIDAEHADGPTKEALRYRTALREGIESLKKKPLSTSTAVAICSAIKGQAMEIRRIPGTQLSNPATREIIYTPPVSEALIREKLANWERFIHEHADYDPLVRMAVAHYQFEAIHPFADGNGRTGRVLNQLMLIENNLLQIPLLYLSRHIIRHKADYYRLLLAVTREQAWEAWVLYMLRGVQETARWTTAKIDAIRKLMAHTADYLRARAPKIYTRELVELIFEQPYCRIQNLVAAELGNRQTASVHLKMLVDIGVLNEVKVGREKLFIHPKFVELLLNEKHDFTDYDAHRKKSPLHDAPVVLLKKAMLKKAKKRSGITVKQKFEKRKTLLK